MSDNFFGGRRVIVLQIAAAALCGVILAIVPANISPFWVIVVVVLSGFIVTGFNGVWVNAASESAPREAAGLATGFDR